MGRIAVLCLFVGAGFSRPASAADRDLRLVDAAKNQDARAVAALLKAKPKPSDADIDKAITNICRCGTFIQVRAAIHAAAASA